MGPGRAKGWPLGHPFFLPIARCGHVGHVCMGGGMRLSRPASAVAEARCQAGFPIAAFYPRRAKFSGMVVLRARRLREPALKNAMHGHLLAEVQWGQHALKRVRVV